MIKKQRGVTLIELLISMTLGLALIGGIGQLFIQSQKSFRLQRNISDMTDDGVFVLEDLARGLSLAGYSADGSTVTSYIGSNSKDNELFYSFKLGDSSQRDNSICLAGSSTTIGSTITVDIFIENTNDLSCVSGTATQPLIQNVEKLVFKYGIRNTQATLDTTDDTFYYTNSTGAAGNWGSVFAIKVFLVLRSEDTNLTRTKTGWSIDGGATEYPTVDEKRIYKVFSKTIYLRAADHW